MSVCVCVCVNSIPRLYRGRDKKARESKPAIQACIYKLSDVIIIYLYYIGASMCISYKRVLGNQLRLW